VKKKSPPYAIIGAALLGIVAIFAFVQWKKAQDAAAQAQIDKAKADMQAEIDAEKAKQAPVVQETNPNMRNVYYATQPVEAGAKISSAFFEKKLTPTDILPDAYTDQRDIVGFFAIRNIEKGDPLTPRNIGKTLPYMSQRISPGMRAISLPVYNSENNSTGGFVVDGDKVDLMFTSMVGDIKTRTQLLMQNLTVLYIPGPKYESDQVQGIVPAPPPGDPISVTFEVTPEQAQALIYFSSAKNGLINMILRARSDKSEIKIKPFEGADYVNNLSKVQKTTDKSLTRVQELAAERRARR
jgi:Flp pilus assembly protein CpaB